MIVDSVCPIANVFRVLLCDMLFAIPKLKSGFENLTIKRKFMILIANIRTDLNRSSLNIHKCDLDLDAPLSAAPNSANGPLPNTLLPSAYTYFVYIDVAAKTEGINKKTTKEKEKPMFQK